MCHFVTILRLEVLKIEYLNEVIEINENSKGEMVKREGKCSKKDFQKGIRAPSAK